MTRNNSKAVRSRSQHHISIFTVLFIALSLLSFSTTQAQDSTTINLQGFIDAYYAFDLDEPSTGYRQPFLFHHNRHNEFNVNLALIRLSVYHPRYRGVVALQGGTYAQDNYAAEESMLKNLFEAYAGIALDNQSKLWLDAGVFGSNLGFANAMSTENFTLTRSLVAESSPYFLSGAKLTYTPSDQWVFVLLASNGWQRIKRLEGNSLVSTGTQIQYLPNEKILLNWSTFIGTEDPDETRRMRYFNNLYGTFQLGSKLDLITGFDIGWQEQSKGSSKMDTWYGPVAIVHIQWTDKWGIATRAEYFHDPEEVVVPTGDLGFKTTGFSLNMDYQPEPNVMLRVEGRYFNSPDDIYFDGSNFADTNFFLTASLAVKFDRDL